MKYKLTVVNVLKKEADFFGVQLQFKQVSDGSFTEILANDEIHDAITAKIKEIDFQDLYKSWQGPPMEGVNKMDEANFAGKKETPKKDQSKDSISDNITNDPEVFKKNLKEHLHGSFPGHTNPPPPPPEKEQPLYKVEQISKQHDEEQFWKDVYIASIRKNISLPFDHADVAVKAFNKRFREEE